MKQRLAYFFGQDGFLRMNTNLPEFTIFFRKENGFVSTVVLVDLDENPYVTSDAIASVRNKAKWKFMDQGLNEVHNIILVISKDIPKAVLLNDGNPFYWIVDSQKRVLEIPDGCVEDFYGMKESICGWLAADFDKADSEVETYQVNGRQLKSFRQQPFINHLIFITNLIVFTLCTLTGDLLYTYGRLTLQEVADGEWYRIITALFLHGNVTHISSNMIMLFLLGNVLEKEMGHIKYFILYFGSGILASCTSLYFQSVHLALGETVRGSIGASGAIFGIMGGFLWVLLRNHKRASNMSFVRVLFLVCYCLFGGLTETRIDNAAHFGGLFAGMFIAILIYRKKKPKKEATTGEN